MKQVDQAKETVRRVVNQWDPYGLLRLGCPVDEFDPEVDEIVRQLGKLKSPFDAANIISQTFSNWFYDPVKFCPANCIEVGERLFEKLQEQQLV